jgi:predicted ATPase
MATLGFPSLITPDSSRRPTLAVVSGRPGSGKSTLARKLADAGGAHADAERWTLYP